MLLCARARLSPSFLGGGVACPPRFLFASPRQQQPRGMSSMPKRRHCPGRSQALSWCKQRGSPVAYKIGELGSALEKAGQGALLLARWKGLAASSSSRAPEPAAFLFSLSVFSPAGVSRRADPPPLNGAGRESGSRQQKSGSIRVRTWHRAIGKPPACGSEAPPPGGAVAGGTRRLGFVRTAGEKKCLRSGGLRATGSGRFLQGFCKCACLGGKHILGGG